MIDNLANLHGMRHGGQSAELAQIQSARNALRLLDSAITRTELRLRALPKHVPSGSGAAPRQRLSDRAVPRKMAFNRQLVPIKMGQQGLGLNPAAMNFGGKGATAALGFHIVAGLGNQIMDTGEQMKAVRQAGGSMSEQAAVPVLQTGRKIVDLLGVTSMSKMLLRDAFGAEEANRRVENTLDSWFLPPSIQKQQQERRKAAITNALAGVTRQWKDDLAFLDSWTPDDFEVYGDDTLTAMRAELWRKNRDYLLAISDVRSDKAVDLAAQNSGAD